MGERFSVRGRNMIADAICYRRQVDVTWLPPTFPRRVRGKNRQLAWQRKELGRRFILHPGRGVSFS